MVSRVSRLRLSLFRATSVGGAERYAVIYQARAGLATGPVLYILSVFPSL